MWCVFWNTITGDKGTCSYIYEQTVILLLVATNALVFTSAKLALTIDSYGAAER